MPEHTLEERQNLRISETVPPAERGLYEASAAFGTFGIRQFSPTPMIAPHWHGHVEFNLVRDGTLTYDYDGREVRVEPGQLVSFWAGIPHHLTNVTPDPGKSISQLNLYIPVDRFLFMPHISKLQMALLGGAIAKIPSGIISEDKILQWKEDYQTNNREHREVMRMEINTCLRRALLDGITYLQPGERPIQASEAITSPQHVKLVEMVRYILENLPETLTISSVAEVVDLHPNYASSLFTNTLKLPMKRFIIRMRLLRARARLIEANIPINVIADDSGFTSLSQFYDHFKIAYGISPLQMRKQMLAAVDKAS